MTQKNSFQLEIKFTGCADPECHCGGRWYEYEARIYQDSKKIWTSSSFDYDYDSVDDFRHEIATAAKELGAEFDLSSDRIHDWDSFGD